MGDIVHAVEDTTQSPHGRAVIGQASVVATNNLQEHCSVLNSYIEIGNCYAIREPLIHGFSALY